MRRRDSAPPSSRPQTSQKSLWTSMPMWRT
jgi:hypothetical protein